MTLREKQSLFVVLIAKLVLWAEAQGYALTFGEAWRSPEEAERLNRAGKGILTSLHCKRLAIDLNLFVRGEYQRDTEAYRPLGEEWESFSTPDYTCTWGGSFTRPDGNHFSIAHGGRA